MTDTDPDDLATLEDVAEGVAKEAAEAMAGRLEYYLRGAWRAGYDLVHVYEPLPEWGEDFRDRFRTEIYLLESHHGDTRPEPPTVRYLYSYDLTSVSDAEIREAIRGSA